MLITSLNETRGSVSEMSFQFSDLSSMRYLGRRRLLLKGTRLRGQFALAIPIRDFCFLFNAIFCDNFQSRLICLKFQSKSYFKRAINFLN